LPVVIVDVQRGGPSTGLPTKPEQTDLLQALFGRNGESPLPVIAAASPTDCFSAAMEACRVAIRYMTPVVLLTDGYIANSSEPWRIPNVSGMQAIEVKHPTEALTGEFKPYQRDKNFVRPWAIPGTAGYEHRLGGLEKQDVIGCVSHDPMNHEIMTKYRAAKVAGITPPGVPYFWTGSRSGDVLIMGWGGTHGAIKAATLLMESEGIRVSSCHLRYLNPLPADLAERMSHFSEIIVAELNMGQLALLLRAKYLIDVKVIAKVRGQPFTIQEVVRGVKRILAHDTNKAPLPPSTVGTTMVVDEWLRDQVISMRHSCLADDDE
jgi:2-oxoglutarate/2-oxoacid ferredoxin oxidoreductase subunit alpha